MGINILSKAMERIKLAYKVCFQDSSLINKTSLEAAYLKGRRDEMQRTASPTEASGEWDKLILVNDRLHRKLQENKKEICLRDLTAGRALSTDETTFLKNEIDIQSAELRFLRMERDYYKKAAARKVVEFFVNKKKKKQD